MKRGLLLASLCAAACAQDIAVSDSGPLVRRDAGPNEDATTQPDPDAAEPPGNDATTTTPDTGTTTPCIGDPFTTCDDPEESAHDNDTWPYATHFNDNNTVGCFDADDLTPLDRTRTGKICARESIDFYDLTLVGCDTRTMFAELRLHVTTPSCEPSSWNFIFQRGGGVVTCDSGVYMIQCLEENGDKVIRLRVPPDRTVFSWQFAIETAVTDLALEYELTVRIQ